MKFPEILLFLRRILRPSPWKNRRRSSESLFLAPLRFPVKRNCYFLGNNIKNKKKLQKGNFSWIFFRFRIVSGIAFSRFFDIISNGRSAEGRFAGVFRSNINGLFEIEESCWGRKVFHPRDRKNGRVPFFRFFFAGQARAVCAQKSLAHSRRKSISSGRPMVIRTNSPVISPGK